jgi:hypothetical protein
MERWGTTMKKNYKASAVKIFIAFTALTVVTANTSLVNAATKTIVCYKGTVTKKVTAATPKCPTGYSTKKPVVKVTPKPAATTAKPATSGGTAFSGTYKGKISMLWSASDVQATSVTGAGTGTILGLDTLSGSGSSAPSSQCDSINGSGTLSGGGNTLKVTFDTSSKACGAEGAAPTVVNITGTAVINGGTGKYAGATGTLKVTGSFAVNSTEAGTKESTALTLTLVGNISTK